jgi:hypothetical protein
VRPADWLILVALAAVIALAVLYSPEKHQEAPSFRAGSSQLRRLAAAAPEDAPRCLRGLRGAPQLAFPVGPQAVRTL